MADDTNSVRPDREFFEAANEYLEIARKQTEAGGVNRASIASMFAIARFSSHVFMGTVPEQLLAANRTAWLDHTAGLFRRMLNEQLDALGHERGVNVGVSEVAQHEPAAASADVAADAAPEGAATTSAADYVAASGALPPSNDLPAQ